MSIQSCVFFSQGEAIEFHFFEIRPQTDGSSRRGVHDSYSISKRIPEILLAASSRRRINGLSGISPKKKVPLSGKILDLALHVRAMVVSCECPAAGFLHVDNPAISDDRT